MALTRETKKLTFYHKFESLPNGFHLLNKRRSRLKSEAKKFKTHKCLDDIVQDTVYFPCDMPVKSNFIFDLILLIPGGFFGFQ